MSIDDLVAEAQRQLTVCNACRYCEGYCAVFPALERRNLLGDGDVTQLANLCHDCRACFHACMYAPPHDFELNPPAVLAEVRLAGYEKYIPRPQMGRRAFGLVLGVAALLVLGLVAWTGSLVPGNGSPYAVLPFAVLLPLMLIPCVWSVVVVLRGGARYWRDVHGRLRDLADPAALWQATRYAATLRYLRGGGDDCYYPSAEPSPVRRNLHAATFYGFFACFASTISAGIMEHFLGLLPPYPLYSVPVVLGVLGGLGLVTGCTGLITVKLRSDRVPAAPAMIVRDYGLLFALDALGATGLLTTLLRDTPAFGPVLVVHLITVVACFAAAPYSKFVHFQYRFLALVKDGLEKRRH